MAEADIVINGSRLALGQAMAVRMAVCDLLSDLADPEMMANLGEMGPDLKARLSEVLALLVKAGKG